MEKWKAVVLTCEIAVSSGILEFFQAISSALRNPNCALFMLPPGIKTELLSIETEITSSALLDRLLQSGVGRNVSWTNWVYYLAQSARPNMNDPGFEERTWLAASDPLTALRAKPFSKRTAEGRDDIRKVWTTVVVKDSCIEIRFGSTIVEDLDAEGRRREK